jgi:hypothetical protein
MTVRVLYVYEQHAVPTHHCHQYGRSLLGGVSENFPQSDVGDTVITWRFVPLSYKELPLFNGLMLSLC